MRRVIWQKMIEAADERSLSEIAACVSKPVIVVLASLLMLKDGRGFNALMEWQDFSLPAIVVAIATVYGLPALWRLLRTPNRVPHQGLWTHQTGASGVERLEGAPLDDLIDHMIETNSFKRATVEARFSIPRHRVTLLGDRLEEVGILERGPNNARVLAPMSRERIRSMLAGKRVAEEIEREVEIVRPTPSLPSFSLRAVSQ